MVRGLWHRGTDCILDVCVTDVDAASYQTQRPDKVLAKHEKRKKAKYLQACLDNRRHFTPFIVSTDGLLGAEAKAPVLTKLSTVLAAKWDRPYSVARGFVNARISFAIARATHLCLRGSRVPARHMSYPRHVQWHGNGAGLRLFRC